MIRYRKVSAVLILSLLFSAVLSLPACARGVAAEDLMSGIQAGEIKMDNDLPGKEAEAVVRFSVDLFKQCGEPGTNTLISPFSVLYALAMTANGARGDTLTQLETLFGLSMEELNPYLYSYRKSLPDSDKLRVRLADSIWFRDDSTLQVKTAFLQTNADYYGAAAFKAPFDDETLREINAWVSDQTSGRIQNILDQIPEQAVLYLVNAMTFDAQWQDIYREDQVKNSVFTTESGEKRDARMMSQTETAYLDDGFAKGFIKYYAGLHYAFAALLPNEGVSLADYVASLDGPGLSYTLTHAKKADAVYTALPKFSCEDKTEMSEMLRILGVTDAFDGALADFSGIGSSDAGNLFISRVLHQTMIEVDENGTKAGAATVVEVSCAGEAVETVTITLDRPFVYLIFDCYTGIPLFLGTMADPGR